jgi:small subunit ribosomal protein S17
MMQNTSKKRKTRVITGTVTSAKMQKTIVVQSSRLTVHPMFKKTIKRFSKFKAHDEKNAAQAGDVVKIAETRPLTKDKRWRLVEIVKK